jgi:undecaprenyl-diphosphatase
MKAEAYMTQQAQQQAQQPEQQYTTTANSNADSPAYASGERSSLVEVPPSPQAQREAAPAKAALRAALQQIQTPEDAQRVVDELLREAGWQTEPDVDAQEGEIERPADKVADLLAEQQKTDDAGATMLEAARGVAGSSGEVREALEQALIRATNPEQYGEQDEEVRSKLDMLRSAVLRRMSPLQSLDTSLFLTINHLPHTRLTNSVMYGITSVMNGGLGWIIGLAVAAVVDKKRGLQALSQVAPPLWFASMTVEYPIKSYFRRKRPFIEIVQAIAVGKKPGSYSFPSGHSASAFAGAWLLSYHYPELRGLWYTVASLVGFSRMYLGVHYPGDVLSGAVSGIVLAEFLRWVMAHDEENLKTHPTARAIRHWL